MVHMEDVEMGMVDKKKIMSEWMKWEGGPPAQKNDDCHYDLMSFRSARYDGWAVGFKYVGNTSELQDEEKSFTQ